MIKHLLTTSYSGPKNSLGLKMSEYHWIADNKSLNYNKCKQIYLCFINDLISSGFNLCVCEMLLIFL